MPKSWSRVVWATPGTAPRQPEEGEAGANTIAETGRRLGPESCAGGEAEAGAGAGRAGVTVSCTYFPEADTHSVHSPLGK